MLQEKEWELEEERGMNNVMERERGDSRRGRRDRKGEKGEIAKTGWEK